MTLQVSLNAHTLRLALVIMTLGRALAQSGADDCESERWRLQLEITIQGQEPPIPLIRLGIEKPTSRNPLTVVTDV